MLTSLVRGSLDVILHLTKVLPDQFGSLLVCNVKIHLDSVKTAVTAASTLICLAAARLAVPVFIFVFFLRLSQQLLPAFVASNSKLISNAKKKKAIYWRLMDK